MHAMKSGMLTCEFLNIGRAMMTMQDRLGMIMSIYTQSAGKKRGTRSILADS